MEESQTRYPDAKLTEPEVIALRLYTGPMFVKCEPLAVLACLPMCPQAPFSLSCSSAHVVHYVTTDLLPTFMLSMAMPTDNAVLRGIGKEETRCKTKGGRKEYMLSGDVKMDGTNQFACRLISRGDGWWTISERSLTDESGKYLRERNILRAPGKKDVVVDRYFERSK